MAQVGVNKDGTEAISEFLVRAVEESGLLKESDKTNGEFWISPLYDSDWGLINTAIPLPKGTIKKLIGRELTWEDEAVTIEE